MLKNFCCFKGKDKKRLPVALPRATWSVEPVDCNANPKDGPYRLTIKCVSKFPDDFAQARRVVLNAQNQQGQTSVHLAVLQCNAKSTDLFLERGADVNIQDKSGNTPLHLAVFSENNDCTSAEYEERLEMVKSLLRRGSDVNVRNGNLDTPLMMAVRGWRLDIVKLLLVVGADVHARNKKGQTCLHLLFAGSGKTDMMIELIKAGAMVETLDEDGRTPLWCILHREGAKQENLKEAKEFVKAATLLSNGGEINFSASQELGSFADDCHKEVVLMKSISFGTVCNLLDFVTQGIDVTRINNEDKVIVMKSIFHAIMREDLQIYTYCVEALFQRSYLCGKVMKKRIYAKNNFYDAVFPDHLIPELCKFLAVNDLLNLLIMMCGSQLSRTEK